MARGGQQNPTDWVTRAADDAIRHAGDGNLVTVASGASPSGPIHLGNLREFLTPHFVAEELRRRGVPVRHLHSWDDYDRFRKVPLGVDPAWAEHIGRPLSGVPDPWDCHPSWAEHFKAPLRAALAELGVEMEELDQTELYRAGTYREQILLAVRRRDEIESVLARHRTRAPVGRVGGGGSRIRRFRGPRRRGRSRRARPLPVQAVVRTVRTGHDDGDRVRRRNDRPRLRLRGLRVHRHHQPRERGRRQARLEGRLADALGFRARGLRTRRPRPHDARLVVHRRAGAGRLDLRLAGAIPGHATPSSASRGCRRCRRRVEVCRRRPTP